ncbi:MAG: DUF4174 domain-containing protein [Paracoccaceae bacterium]
MRAIVFVFAGFLAGAAWAEGSDIPAPESVFIEEDIDDLKQFIWEKRPIIVFADSPNDPNFNQQMELLRDRVEELAERDVIVLTDTDPDGQSQLRQKLRPRGFALVLVGKDGAVKLRKPFPWDVRELSRSIDKMPMRKREIRERTGSN